MREQRQHMELTEAAMSSAILANRSQAYARRRASQIESRARLTAGPVDMERTAMRMAAAFPGTVKRRDH